MHPEVCKQVKESVTVLAYTTLFMVTVLLLLPEGGLKKIAFSLLAASVMVLLLKTGKYNGTISFSGKKNAWEGELEESVQQETENMQNRLLEEIEKTIEEQIENKAEEMEIFCKAELRLDTENYSDIKIKEMILTYEEMPDEDRMTSFAYWIAANFDVNMASQRHNWN